MDRRYQITGIDVHKRARGVIADAAEEGALQSQRRKFTLPASGLEQLAAWLRQRALYADICRTSRKNNGTLRQPGS